MAQFWYFVFGLFGAFVTLCGRSAFAGAFLQPQGSGIVIVQSSLQSASRAWDYRGRLLPIRSWRRTDVAVYAEYGVTDSITMIGHPSWLNFQSQKNYSPDRSQMDRSQEKGIGATLIGLRAKAIEWDGGDTVISLQASARIFQGSREAAAFSDMRSRIQMDLRVLYGQNVTFLTMPAFLDQQIALRSDGPRGHQLRMESTLGVQPMSGLMILLQEFNTITLARLGRGFGLENKTQVSVVVDIAKNFSLQIGYRYAFRGVECANDRGPIFGLWARF